MPMTLDHHARVFEVAQCSGKPAHEETERRESDKYVEQRGCRSHYSVKSVQVAPANLV